jgi:hypothetical protein
MRHILRVNDRDVGYRLVTVNSRTVTTHPIGLESDEIDLDYLEMEKKFDDLVEEFRFDRFMTVTVKPDWRVEVAYGYRLPIKDRFGRLGILFFHLVRGERRDLPYIVSNILLHSESEAGQRRSELLERLSLGSVSLESVVLTVIDEVESKSSEPLGHHQHWARPLPTVRYDCDGRVLAWTALLASHLSVEPPWVLGDAVDSDRFYVTRTSAHPSKSVIQMSELINRALREMAQAKGLNSSTGKPSIEAVAPPEGRNVEVSGGRTKRAARSAETNPDVDKVNEAWQRPPHSGGKRSDPTPASTSGSAGRKDSQSELFARRREGGGHSHDRSEVASFVGLLSQRTGLSLRTAHREYEVTLSNCLRLVETTSYYVFEVKESFYWIFRESRFLYVEKSRLSDRQTRSLWSVARYFPLNPS